MCFAFQKIMAGLQFVLLFINSRFYKPTNGIQLHVSVLFYGLLGMMSFFSHGISSSETTHHELKPLKFFAQHGLRALEFFYFIQ